jgi:hypothetical protein
MSESKTGAATPSTVTVIGGGDGTNARTLKVSSSGVVSVDGSAVTQPVSGTVTANAGTGTMVVDTIGGRTILFASISAASSGNNTIISAVTSKKITVLGYVLVADGAVTAQWQDGASGTALSGAMSFAANGGVSAHLGGIPMMQGSTATLLNLNLGGAVGVRGHIAYYTV